MSKEGRRYNLSNKLTFNEILDDEIALEDEIGLIRDNLFPTILVYGMDDNFEEVSLDLEGDR